jgi:hypothetical protein
VPELSRFLGIVIAMFHKDHGPPHFHAFYAEHEIQVRLADGQVDGRFPPKAQAYVLEWYNLHRQELDEAWALARQRLPLKRIAPLEQPCRA